MIVLLRLKFLLFATWSVLSSVAFRPPKLSEELGCSPTLSTLLNRGGNSEPSFYFDPLELARDDNFARLREAELKHGRVCMLAVAEIIFIPIIKRIGFFKSVIPNLQDISDSVLYNNRINGFQMFQVVAVCAVLEAFVFWQRDPKAMPGDYGLAYFGLRDKGLHEEKLVVELENGRLAMIGFVGFLASDFVTGGESWLDQWLVFFTKWVDQFPTTVSMPAAVVT